MNPRGVITMDRQVYKRTKLKKIPKKRIVNMLRHYKSSFILHVYIILSWISRTIIHVVIIGVSWIEMTLRDMSWFAPSGKKASWMMWTYYYIIRSIIIDTLFAFCNTLCQWSLHNHDNRHQQPSAAKHHVSCTRSNWGSIWRLPTKIVRRWC